MSTNFSTTPVSWKAQMRSCLQDYPIALALSLSAVVEKVAAVWLFAQLGGVISFFPSVLFGGLFLSTLAIISLIGSAVNFKNR